MCLCIKACSCANTSKKRIHNVPRTVIWSWLSPPLPTTYEVHPFNGPFSRTTRVSRYQKGKPKIWILLKQETVSGSGINWDICKSATHSRQITTPTPHHWAFYRPDALPATETTTSKQHYVTYFPFCEWCRFHTMGHNTIKAIPIHAYFCYTNSGGGQNGYSRLQFYLHTLSGAASFHVIRAKLRR